MKKQKKDDGPLKMPLISFMIHDQHRLEVLGKLFSRFNMSLFDYLKRLRKEKRI